MLQEKVDSLKAMLRGYHIIFLGLSFPGWMMK